MSPKDMLEALAGYHRARVELKHSPNCRWFWVDFDANIDAVDSELGFDEDEIYARLCSARGAKTEEDAIVNFLKTYVDPPKNRPWLFFERRKIACSSMEELELRLEIMSGKGDLKRVRLVQQKQGR